MDKPTAAGIYVRISDDRTGERAGVQRQEQDCRELAENRGWPVRCVYVDNDVSAYRGKPRPEYRRLLQDMKGGLVDAVVVWHLDRLHRHPKELEEFFEAADLAGVTHLASVSGDVDLGSHDGRFHARILGAVARKESDDKARRIRRKHEELARAGKMAGGGHRPFGYEADRRTVDKGEAKLIQEAADRVLAGQSMRSVLIDWQERGITTPTGKSWRSSPLRRMLLSPRVAGLREHRGEVVGPAEWKGVIDEATHRRLVTVLTDPRRKKFDPGSARRYLLSGGLAVCGACGVKLVARPKGDKRRGYVCAKGPNFDGCGKVYTLAEPIEELVREAVFTALDGPGLIEALRVQQEADGGEAELLEAMRADQETLDQLAKDHYADRLISRSEYLAARDAIEQRLEATKARLGGSTSNRVLADLPSGREALEVAWEAADLSWRRSLLAAVLDRVVVNPAVKGRNFFRRRSSEHGLASLRTIR